MRIVVVGGGAAGIGAAGAAKQVDPHAEVIVLTEFEDVGYSPCGIPYVHGREIERFETLFLQDKQFYRDAGLDIRYETRAERVDLSRGEIMVEGQGSMQYDRLVLATGWTYTPPGIAGSDLDGLYFMKNIRQAMEFDKVLDAVKVAVVMEAGPLGLEMATALAHRGIETHFVDPRPWLFAEVADPDIMEFVAESLTDLGVTMHLSTRIEEILGNGRVRAVRTTEGELPADVVIVSTHKQPDNRLARDAGLKIGSTGGLVVDAGMRTSAPGVFAAGDCIELPHTTTNTPIQGLSGSHAYAQGKVAGANAAGARRTYHPVSVPWGLVAGTWMIGGVSFGETLATALGVPFVLGRADGISRARYFPGFSKIRVKLLADPRSHRLIGAQMVGGEGIKERADFLGMAVKTGITAEDLAWMENVYSPAIGALNEPIALAAQNLLSRLNETGR